MGELEILVLSHTRVL